jgi:pyruvate,water dikinase
MHTKRALAYRQWQRASLAATCLSVLVQQLVPADVSAVVFSANPVSGCDQEVMINASWGLGESLVGGTVTPDTFIVRKSDLVIDGRDIADKRRMTVLTPHGTHEVPVPREHQQRPSIDDVQVVELVGLSIALETAMGWPVDVECA